MFGLRRRSNRCRELLPIAFKWLILKSYFPAARPSAKLIRQPQAERRALGREPRLCGLGDGEIPVEDLGAVPMQDAIDAARVIVNRSEALEAVLLAADIAVNPQLHDLGAALALGIETIELIDRALGEIFALVVLDDHDTDVVDLDRVRERDQRPFGGADDGRLVVVDPVADI